MKLKVYNPQGEVVSEREVSEAIFGVKPRANLVHQVYTAHLANARQPWADTKDRGEVRGGGKKPWKQKGTGRARHGSIRSPLWKGGGVTFGPLSIRNYKQKINKKMNALAVKMCLSDKVSEGKLVVVNELVTAGKTNTLSKIRRQLPGANRTALILSVGGEADMQKAVRNLPKTSLVRASDVNVVDFLHHQYVIAVEAGLQILEKRLE